MEPDLATAPTALALSPSEVKARVSKRLRDRDRDNREGRSELPAANAAEFKK